MQRIIFLALCAAAFGQVRADQGKGNEVRHDHDRCLRDSKEHDRRHRDSVVFCEKLGWTWERESAYCTPPQALVALLMGPRGVPGPAGPEGPMGLPGVNGVDGLPGPQGPRGEPGARGPQGLPGLAGLDGVDGLPGPAGPQGPQGAQGPMGPAGPMGPQGPMGLQGAVGPTGPTGPAGAAPTEAPAGTSGSSGTSSGAGTGASAPAAGSTSTTVATPVGLASAPAVSQDAWGSRLIVTWTENSPYGGPRVTLAQSLDGGVSFGPSQDLGTFPASYYGSGWPVPVVRGDGSILVMSFQGGQSCSGSVPATLLSTDGGRTFQARGQPVLSAGYYTVGRTFTWNRAGTQLNLLPQGSYKAGCSGLNDLGLTYYRSLDGGLTYQGTVLMPQGGIARGSAAVAQLDSGSVVAVWLEATTTSRLEVQVRVSQDAGLSFASPPVGGSPSVGLAGAVSGLALQAAGDVASVFFTVDGVRFAATSEDGGRTFGPPEVVANGPVGRAIGNGRVSVWGNSSGLYCKTSRDNARTWPTPPSYLTAAGPSIGTSYVTEQTGGFGAPLRMVWLEGGKIRLGEVTAACQ